MTDSVKKITPYEPGSGESYDVNKLREFDSADEMIGYYQWGKTRGETETQKEEGEFWDNGRGIPIGDGPFSHTAEETASEREWRNRTDKDWFKDNGADDQHDDRER